MVCDTTLKINISSSLKHTITGVRTFQNISSGALALTRHAGQINWRGIWFFVCLLNMQPKYYKKRREKS